MLSQAAFEVVISTGTEHLINPPGTSRFDVDMRMLHKTSLLASSSKSKSQLRKSDCSYQKLQYPKL
jgi:hypothetical protein